MSIENYVLADLKNKEIFNYTILITKKSDWLEKNDG